MWGKSTVGSKCAVPEAYPTMKSTYTSRNLNRSLKRICERKNMGTMRESG